MVLQFVIDASSRQQVAAATVHLIDMLTATQLQASSVLIVLNKRLVCAHHMYISTELAIDLSTYLQDT